MSQVQTEAQAPKQTYVEKLTAQYNALAKDIAAKTEKANSIAAELQNIQAIEALVAGSQVVVKLGRKFSDKDTTRFVDGVVLAVKDDESGRKLFRVQVGSGFDADVVTVSASDLKTSGTAEEANNAYAASQVSAAA